MNPFNLHCSSLLIFCANDNTMIIRKATIDDAGALLNCVLLLDGEDGSRHKPIITADDIVTAGFGSDPLFEALIAEDEAGAVLGALSFFRGYSGWSAKPTCYVHMLYVSAEHRRQGIGRALIAEVAKLTLARGWPRLELLAETARPAKKFYAAIGMDTGGITYFRASGETLKSLAI